MPIHHLVMAIMIAAIWGGNLVAIKMGLEQFPPFLLSSLRFFLILAALFPFLKIVRGQMKYVIGICIFAGALHFALTFVGLNMAGEASAAAIAVQLNVPFATLLAVMFLGEKVHFWRIFGISLAFAGVLVLGFDPQVLQYVNALYVIGLAALVYAIGAVLMRKVKGAGVFQLQAWIALISFPFLALLSFTAEPDQWRHIPEINGLTAGSVLFSAIGASLMGHGGIYYLLQRYPVAVVSPALLLGPVFGVIFAVMFLGDTLTTQMILGGLVTLTGVAIITLREKKPTPPALEGPLPMGREG